MATEAPPPSEDKDPAGRPSQGADDLGANDSGANDPGAPDPGPVDPGASSPSADDSAGSERDADGAGEETTGTPPRAVGVARAPNRLPPPVDPYADDYYDPQPYATPPPEAPLATVAGEDTGEEPVLTWRPSGQEPWPTWPKPAQFSAVAQFEDPYEVKPQARSPARAQIPPAVPLDPILPYISPPVPRRRKSDWPVLVIALIVSALVMMTCCIAGFALYNGYAPAFL